MLRWLWLLLLLAACVESPPAPLPTLAVLPSVTPTEAVRPLAFWQAQEGVLQAGEQALYTFTGRAGDAITLRVVSTGSITLSLLTQSNALLLQGNPLETRLPADGAYRVRLVANEATAYALGLSYSGQPNPNASTPVPVFVGVPTPTPDRLSNLGAVMGELSPNSTLGGTLTADKPVHVYSITLAAREYVTLRAVRISGTLDPFLTLYDTQGMVMAQDGNSAGNRNAQIANVRVPAAGQYVVQVSGGNFYGDYQLTVATGYQPVTPDLFPTPTALPMTPFVPPTVGALPQGERLRDHVPALGKIETAGGFARFAFYADAADVVTLNVAPLGRGTLRPQVDVYTPEGALLANARASTSGDAGRALVSGLAIPESGAYLVIVTSEDNTTGEFSVAFGRGATHTDAHQGIANAQERHAGVLRFKGQRDTWLVRLQAGDVITAAVNAENSVALDPVLDIVTLDGVVLARDDNSGGGTAPLLRSVPINETGQYLLRVSAARGDQTGAYTLVWRYVNLAPSATPPPRQTTLLSLDDTVIEGQYRFYTFYGQAGMQINIQVIAKPAAPFDPVAVLLDAEGSVIGEGDDSDGTLNPNFTVTLPRDGAYTVRVNGYLSGGAFDLWVRWFF